MVQRMFGGLIKQLMTWACLLSAMGSAIAGGELYSSSKDFEPDKCASVWLIKRYGDTDARFRFYPQSKDIDAGIPFDTPDARLRRYQNRSTYETLLEHFSLVDEKLVHIGRLIRDMEVNVWERKRFPETIGIQADIRERLAGIGPDDSVRVCLEYFDLLYEQVSVP